MNSKIQFFAPLCVLLTLITSSSVSVEINPEALRSSRICMEGN